MAAKDTSRTTANSNESWGSITIVTMIDDDTAEHADGVGGVDVCAGVVRLAILMVVMVIVLISIFDDGDGDGGYFY